MAISTGTKFGSYVVAAEIGTGGQDTNPTDKYIDLDSRFAPCTILPILGYRGKSAIHRPFLEPSAKFLM
jgi:hypothetical protein